jgi:hypothetical protein
VLLNAAVAACRGDVAGPFGAAEDLAVRVELGATVITTQDTLPLRLVAHNPLTIPVRFEVRCGDGLRFSVADSVGRRVDDDGGLCIPDYPVVTIEVAAGDSIVRDAGWWPWYYVDVRTSTHRPPGTYYALALLRSQGQTRATSPAVAFELRLP